MLALIAAAAGMVLVIYSESLGAAETFAAKHGYEIDPNQELIALGAVNAGSGLVGGLAGGGSLSQTAVNDGAGARSQTSPLIATVLALVTVLFLTPLFKSLPEAVLAALIIHAVSHLMKVHEFRRYYADRPHEFWLGLARLIGVITLDVLPGLVIGVVAVLVFFVFYTTPVRLTSASSARCRAPEARMGTSVDTPTTRQLQASSSSCWRLRAHRATVAHSLTSSISLGRQVLSK